MTDFLQAENSPTDKRDPERDHARKWMLIMQLLGAIMLLPWAFQVFLWVALTGGPLSIFFEEIVWDSEMVIEVAITAVWLLFPLLPIALSAMSWRSLGQSRYQRARVLSFIAFVLVMLYLLYDIWSIVNFDPGF